MGRATDGHECSESAARMLGRWHGHWARSDGSRVALEAPRHKHVRAQRAHGRQVRAWCAPGTGGARRCAPGMGGARVGSAPGTGVRAKRTRCRRRARRQRSRHGRCAQGAPDEGSTRVARGQSSGQRGLGTGGARAVRLDMGNARARGQYGQCAGKPRADGQHAAGCARARAGRTSWKILERPGKLLNVREWPGNVLEGPGTL